MKTLVISGHPDYESSLANKAILDEFHGLMPEAEIVRLAQLYPDFNIDVAKEQQRLLEADTIVFEFPFWWYGAPSLIHRYLEQVFTHGWAYGSTGKALHGKRFILSFTVGGTKENYTPQGGDRPNIEPFMTSMRTSGEFTGMIYKGAVVSYDMKILDPNDKAKVDAFYAETRSHARKLAELIAR